MNRSGKDPCKYIIWKGEQFYSNAKKYDPKSSVSCTLISSRSSNRGQKGLEGKKNVVLRRRFRTIPAKTWRPLVPLVPASSATRFLARQLVVLLTVNPRIQSMQFHLSLHRSFHGFFPAITIYPYTTSFHFFHPSIHSFFSRLLVLKLQY